tara:strand:+ start:231 stop:722 length:492 start_codon:yes stop_codon:yes gene_type:complete
MWTDEMDKRLRNLRASPDYLGKLWSNGVTKFCGRCKAGDNPHPAPAEYEVRGKQVNFITGNVTPFRAYLCESHLEGMGAFEDDKYEIHSYEWRPGMLIPKAEANELVREFTGYETFTDICRNYPDLTYRQDVWGRGEKYWRHNRLCKFYKQATGVTAYAPLVK